MIPVVGGEILPFFGVLHLASIFRVQRTLQRLAEEITPNNLKRVEKFSLNKKIVILKFPNHRMLPL
jgi:hypothetical protein